MAKQASRIGDSATTRLFPELGSRVAGRRMRVELVFEIDCDAHAAWEAIHSPAVAEQLYGPLLQLRPAADLPQRWQTGDEATVEMRLLGGVPAGSQVIRVSDYETHVDGVRVRVMRDSGRPLTGPLAVLTNWDHRMAVCAVPGQPHRTLWRDRVIFGGAAAPLLWPGLWLTWKWRQARISKLAPNWTA